MDRVVSLSHRQHVPLRMIDSPLTDAFSQRWSGDPGFHP